MRELIKEWIAWKTERDGAPYTFKALAEDAGINPKYLSHVMTGLRNPGMKTLGKMAGAFGVPLTVFLDGPPEGGSVTGRAPDDSASRTVGGEHEPVSPVEEPVEEKKDVPPPVQPEGGDSAGAGKIGLKLSGDTSEEFSNFLSTLGFPSEILPSGDVSPRPESEPSAPELPGESPVSYVDEGREAEEPDSRRGRDAVPVLHGGFTGDFYEWRDGFERFEEKYEAVPRFYGVTGGRAFAVRVEDDSMVPDLNAGDVLMADPDSPFTRTNGGIAVVLTGDGVLVRRVFYHDGGYYLVPSNSRHAPRTVGEEDVLIFRIVLWIPNMENRF